MFTYFCHRGFFCATAIPKRLLHSHGLDEEFIKTEVIETLPKPLKKKGELLLKCPREVSDLDFGTAEVKLNTEVIGYITWLRFDLYGERSTSTQPKRRRGLF